MRQWYCDARVVSMSMLFPMRNTANESNMCDCDTIYKIQHNLYYYLDDVNDEEESFQKTERLDDHDWTIVEYKQQFSQQHQVFMVILPQRKRKIATHLKIVTEQSSVFKLMIQSEMIESKTKETTIDGGIEEEVAVERALDFIHVRRLGYPVVDSYTVQLDNVCREELIGMRELLKLMETADVYGIPSLVKTIAKLVNDYNVAVLLKQALTSSEDLSEPIIEESIDVIAYNIPCIIGDLIFYNMLEEAQNQLNGKATECMDKVRENDLLDQSSQVCQMMEIMMADPIVNCLIEVPSDVLLKILSNRSCQLTDDQKICILSVWILNSDFLNDTTQLLKALEFITLNTFNISSPIIENVLIKIIFKLLHIHNLNESISKLTNKIFFILMKQKSSHNVQLSLKNDIVKPLLGFLMKNSTNCADVVSKLLVNELVLSNREQKEDTQKELFQNNSFGILTTILQGIQGTQHWEYLEDILVTGLSIQLSKQIGDFKELESSRHYDAEKTKYQFTLIGLDGSGKTCLLNSIKGKQDEETYPTIGFNSETVFVSNCEIGLVS